jgi:hypothetical protein
MAKAKAEALPGPDIGCYPMMHPYPGFRACKECGGRGTWDGQRRAWVTPMGAIHDCAVTMIHTAAAWQYVVRLTAPRRFP